MNKYSFSDLSLGKRESFNTHLTIEDLFKFKAITGDINPLHCDIEFAKKYLDAKKFKEFTDQFYYSSKIIDNSNSNLSFNDYAQNKLNTIN